jgi:tryptophan-associated transmembrane protein
VRKLAAVLAAAGGSLVVYGSILDWATVGGRRGRSFAVDGTDLCAKLTVAAGLAAVIAGLLAPAATRGRSRLLLGIVVVLAGAAAVAVAAYLAASDQAVLSRIADVPGLRVRRRAVVDPGAGLFVVIAGGALAVLGGALGLITARDRNSPKPAPEPPAVEEED